MVIWDAIVLIMTSFIPRSFRYFSLGQVQRISCFCWKTHYNNIFGKFFISREMYSFRQWSMKITIQFSIGWKIFRIIINQHVKETWNNVEGAFWRAPTQWPYIPGSTREACLWLRILARRPDIHHVVLKGIDQARYPEVIPWNYLVDIWILIATSTLL